MMRRKITIVMVVIRYALWMMSVAKLSSLVITMNHECSFNLMMLMFIVKEKVKSGVEYMILTYYAMWKEDSVQKYTKTF